MSAVRKGFSIIEVLVASVILFSSAVTAAIGYKQYLFLRMKQVEYEKLYVTALTLKDMICSKPLEAANSYSGTLNGFDYSYSVKPVLTARNSVYNTFLGEENSAGNFLITLYRIELKIGGKKFTFYRTQYRKLNTPSI